MYSTNIKIMMATTREQYEAIFYQCMSLIENPECHDGSDAICTKTILNDISKIIDIICLDNNEIKALYTSSTKNKTKHNLAMS